VSTWGEKMRVFVVGLGSVGRALVLKLETMGIEVLGAADSSGALFFSDKFSSRDAIEHKLQRKPFAMLSESIPLATALEIAAKSRDWLCIADCSASATTATTLLEYGRRGHRIVLANKKPLSGPLEIYKQLKSCPFLRHESTVGAGTPVCAVLNRLLASGDQVFQILGVLSGTLGFVCTELGKKRRLSEVVREALAAGYTEPDPRDDLSGQDVARKAVILARMGGMVIEMKDVHVEALFPASLSQESGKSVKQFLDELSTVDLEYQEKVLKASVTGKVLRYAAAIDFEKHKVDIGLKEFPTNDPIGSLQGTDNLIAFRTSIYKSSPLIIQGAGAGIDVTVAGLVADIQELALQSPL